MTNPEFAANTEDDNDGPQPPTPEAAGDEKLPDGEAAVTEPRNAGNAAPPFPAVVPVAAPKSGWRPFAALIGFGVALVLVVALTVTLVVTLTGGDVPGAEERVLAYYNALTEKDGERARKLLKDVDAEIFESDGVDLNMFMSESPFWTSKALQRGYQPPNDVEIVNSAAAAPPGVELRKGRRYAVVTVAYTLGGRSATETLGLERGSEDSGWTIISAPVAGFAQAGDSFRLDIAGHERAASSDGEVCLGCGDCEDCGRTFNASIVFAPPGRYDIAVSEHAVFEDMKATLDIAPGLQDHYGTDFAFDTLDFKLRDGVLADVKSRVEATIDNCASGRFNSYSNCPWDEEESVSVHFDENWDVKSYPKFKIVANYLGEAVTKTVEPGKATGVDRRDDEKITANLVVDGKVIEVDGEIVWDPGSF